MIQKLRKKLIFALMAVVCLFLIAILVSLFITSKNDYERRSINSFNFNDPRHADNKLPTDSSSQDDTATVEVTPEDTPPADEAPDEAIPNTSLMGVPTAMVVISPEGDVSIIRNQIYYVTDDELLSITEALTGQTQNDGLTSDYNLRYRRMVNDEGKTTYFFSDTYVERNSLRAQIIYSVIIGLGAIGLFFIVSMLLSRWMVKPVEKAWEKQRQFVADASHELKTPLTVVLSNTDMLIASGVVTDEKNKNRLDNIRAESQRMKGLVENLLALARSDSTPVLASRVPVNFSYIVTGATLTLEPTVFDLGRTMDCQIDENRTVLGDGNRLRQLVDILLDNAMKYSNPGSPIRVRMQGLSKRELLLTVTSEGTPLPPKECKSIFERFYRSDRSRGEEKGYGLGLAIAQSIVDEHQGRIWAQSDGIKLNHFFIRLPCMDSEDTAAQNQ